MLTMKSRSTRALTRSVKLLLMLHAMDRMRRTLVLFGIIVRMVLLLRPLVTMVALCVRMCVRTMASGLLAHLIVLNW